ncbi:hypothetical protein CSUI_001354 [Cystoisospora suis]|uniref:Uncharacterized protein n=1 Tax=Cystoisospora suis TaxID=483139 RepID=A0A2C6LCV0_9APIC|nr:hypothetical protein CSUI_001354 [Cystoisospora suis]
MRVLEQEVPSHKGHYDDSCSPGSQSHVGEQSLSGVSLAAFRAVTAHLQAAGDQELNAVFSLFSQHNPEANPVFSAQSPTVSPAPDRGRSPASTKVPSTCADPESASKFNSHPAEHPDYFSVATTTSASDAFRPGRISTSSSWSSTSPFAAATFSFLDRTVAGAHILGGCSSSDSSPTNVTSATPATPFLALPKTSSRVTRAESPLKVPPSSEGRDPSKLGDATSASRRRLKTSRKPPRTGGPGESQDTAQVTILQRALRTPVRCSPRLQRPTSPKNASSTPSDRCPQTTPVSCKDGSRLVTRGKCKGAKNSTFLRLKYNQKDVVTHELETGADASPSATGRDSQGAPERASSSDKTEIDSFAKADRLMPSERSESRKARTTRKKPSKKSAFSQAPDHMAGHTPDAMPVSSSRSPRCLKRERIVCEESQEDVRSKRKKLAIADTASYEKDPERRTTATQAESCRERRVDSREDSRLPWLKADSVLVPADPSVNPQCPRSFPDDDPERGPTVTPENDVSRIPALCQLEEPGKTSEDGSRAFPGRCEDRDDGSACSKLRWDYGISNREKQRISSTASTVSSVPASRSFTSLIVSDPPTGAEGGSGVFCSPSISADESPARPVFFRHKVLRPTPELTSPPEFDLGLFLVRTAAVSKHTDDVAPLLEDRELMADSKVLKEYVSCPVDGQHLTASERLRTAKVLADIPKVKNQYHVGGDMQKANWYRSSSLEDEKEEKDTLMESLLETQDSWNPFSIFGSSLPCVELEDVFDYEVYKTTSPSARVSHPLFRRLAQFFEFKDLWRTVTRAEWERVRSAFKTHWKKQYKLDLDWRNDPVTVDEFMWMLEANGQKEDKTSCVFEAEVCFCVTPNPTENFAWNDPRCHRYQVPRPSMSHHILDQAGEHENVSFNACEFPELGEKRHCRVAPQLPERSRPGSHSSSLRSSGGTQRLSVSNEYDPCLVTPCASDPWRLPTLQTRLPGHADG